MAQLAISLSLLAEKAEGEEKRQHLNEAVHLSRKVIEAKSSLKLKGTATFMQAHLYDAMDEKEKALETAEKLPHIWESRELAVFDIKGGEAEIEKLVFLFTNLVYERINAFELSRQKKAFSDETTSSSSPFKTAASGYQSSTSAEEFKSKANEILKFLS